MIHFITICATKKLSVPAPAIDLYKGGYWDIVKEISSKVDYTWILSAQNGLISSNKVIKPYNLSFKPDSQDYIGHIGLNPTKYWDAITCYDKDNSVKKLIESYPNDRFILYASNSYMKAIKNDLLPVIDNKNLYIFSPDTKGKYFTPHILKTSLKLRYVLGGNKITTTAITIKHFLENIDSIGWDKSNINNYFTNMVKDCPEYNRLPNKPKISDDVLIEIIKEIGINTPKTRILKIISSKGFAIGPNRLSRTLFTLKLENNTSN